MKLLKSLTKKSESDIDEVTKKLASKKEKEGFNVKINDSDEKYSELIISFIEPYQRKIVDSEVFYDFLNIGLLAWNFGNIKSKFPKMYSSFLQAVFSQMDLTKDQKKLFDELVNRKQNKFEQYDKFYDDYEIGEDKEGNPILTVICMTPEEFLEKSMEEPEDDFYSDYDESELEPGYINRIAIIIKPKKPFIDWVNHQYHDEPVESIEVNNTYLISDDYKKVDNWIKKNFDKIFVIELENWDETRKNWPKFRSYKLFCEWFSYESSSMIFDFESERISKQ